MVVTQKDGGTTSSFVRLNFCCDRNAQAESGERDDE